MFCLKIAAASIRCLLACPQKLGAGGRTFSSPSGWFGCRNGLFVPNGATVYLTLGRVMPCPLPPRSSRGAKIAKGAPRPSNTPPEIPLLMREGRKTTRSRGAAVAGEECCLPSPVPWLLVCFGVFLSILGRAICEKASPCNYQLI